MATLKIKFRASKVEAREGVLYFQVIHERVVRQINTRCRLYPDEWDAHGGTVVIPPSLGNSHPRHGYLISLRDTVLRAYAGLKHVVERLDCYGTSYTADMVVEQYRSGADRDGFVFFSYTLVNRLRKIGRWRTADKYTTALNSFVRFRGDIADVLLDDIDSPLMVEYENYLKALGVCPNTSSYYMRNLRAMYNRAVEDGITVQRWPFRHVYTGIDKTVKRAVPLKVMRRIKDMDLTHCPQVDFARDVFMFSFYTRGMAFVDMAFLRKCDLSNGILSYRRRKTNQQLFIKWESQMQDIIDKYDTTGSPYLLPIITVVGIDEWKQYLNSLHLVNNKLKLIGATLGLGMPLTTYVARHGWASIAKSKNVPLATISEAMGHDSETTTRIYLMSLDNSGVDRANRIVMKSL